jgi:hypothetical protein
MGQNSKSRLGVRVSEQTKTIIDEMCKGLGVQQSELIERLVINYRRGRFTKDKMNYRARLARALELMSDR